MPLFHNVFGVHFHGEFLEGNRRDGRFDKISDRWDRFGNGRCDSLDYAGQNIKRKYRWGASSDVKGVDRIESGHIH